MTTTKQELLTADELLRLYSRGVRGELIRGVLCKTMSVGQEHGEIVLNLGARLWIFVDAQKLGRLVASDSGVWLEHDPDTVRDHREKIPPGVRVTGYSETVPDLVVEVHSPSDSMREVHDKARMWLSYGVRLVWVVHPDTRTVDVHHQEQSVSTLNEEDALDGMDVLTGFSCAIGDLFPA